MINRIAKNVHKQSGFILTIEAVLIFTILGIGLFVGIVAIRDAWFKYSLSQQDQDFYVFDSTVAPQPIVIGKVMGFDEHEAPLVPFIDYGARTDINGNLINYRALIGVRDDRFTSRQPVFYSDASCSLNPCLAEPSGEASYNIGVDGIAETGGVSYLYALQGITYGIGSGVGGAIKGRLYRQTTTACAANLQYAWDSQRVVIGSPCISIAATGNNPAGFFIAESLERAANENVLDPLIPPFYTNMIGTPSTTYSTVAPGPTEATVWPVP